MAHKWLKDLRGHLNAGEAFLSQADGPGACAKGCKGLRRYAPQKGTSLRRVSHLSIEPDNIEYC